MLKSTYFFIFLCLVIAIGQPCAVHAKNRYVDSKDISNIINGKLPSLLHDQDGVIAAMQSEKLLVLPDQKPLANDFSNFPGRPEYPLRRKISRVQADSGMAISPLLFYFPAENIGGLTTMMAGSGDCSFLMMFSSTGRNAKLIQNPIFLKNATCPREGNNMYVGLFKGQLIALLIEDSTIRASQPPIRIQIDSWTGNGWDVPSLIDLK